MPRLAKAGVLGENLRKPVAEVPDNVLIIAEYSGLFYIIDRYGANKSRLHKVVAFAAMAYGYEIVLQQLISGERVGGDS